MMSPNPPHRWWLRIHPNAKKKFNSLQASEKRTIFRQLRLLLNADAPYSLDFVEMLKDEDFVRSRKFRAGNYRVFFELRTQEVTPHKHTYKGTLYLLDIRDRKEAY